MEWKSAGVRRKLTYILVKLLAYFSRLWSHGDTYWDEEDHEGDIVLDTLKPEVF